MSPAISGCSQLIRFICLLRSLPHPNQDRLAVVTRMVLSSKIQGLNYRPPLLGFPKYYTLLIAFYLSQLMESLRNDSGGGINQ